MEGFHQEENSGLREIRYFLLSIFTSLFITVKDNEVFFSVYHSRRRSLKFFLILLERLAVHPSWDRYNVDGIKQNACLLLKRLHHSDRTDLRIPEPNIASLRSSSIDSTSGRDVIYR